MFNISDPKGGLPGVNFGIALGTAFIDIDLIPFPSNSTGQGLGSIRGWPQNYFTGKQGLLEYFDGRLSSGELAPPGNYTLSVRLLKIMGDPTHADDYEKFTTPSFVLEY